jgi:hypothetical protein
MANPICPGRGCAPIAARRDEVDAGEVRAEQDKDGQDRLQRRDRQDKDGRDRLERRDRQNEERKPNAEPTVDPPGADLPLAVEEAECLSNR